MASLSDGAIYNTELFNVVLEAMDNFKPILFCEGNGGTQLSPPIVTYEGNTSDGFKIGIYLGSMFSYICPSSTATIADLYVPQNITSTSQSEQEPS